MVSETGSAVPVGRQTNGAAIGSPFPFGWRGRKHPVRCPDVHRDHRAGCFFVGRANPRAWCVIRRGSGNPRNGAAQAFHGWGGSAQDCFTWNKFAGANSGSTAVVWGWRKIVSRETSLRGRIPENTVVVWGSRKTVSRETKLRQSLTFQIERAPLQRTSRVIARAAIAERSSLALSDGALRAPPLPSGEGSGEGFFPSPPGRGLG